MKANELRIRNWVKDIKKGYVSIDGIEPNWDEVWLNYCHGSLFSGIGGFDLAAEWAGWENKFHCEWNEFGQKVLNYYWPKAESYGDITKTDFTIWRGRIDVLSGGFPCQPYSLAGKRLGKEDDRHLWPEMLRAIREIQPKWVVGENVFGIINWNGGLVFDEVQTDLETEGYEVQAYVLPAVSVNAPHRRDRVWFVAHRHLHGQHGSNSKYENAGTIADTNSGRLERSETLRRDSEYVERKSGNGFSSDSGSKRLQRSKKRGSLRESREKSNQQPTRFFCPNWQSFPTQPPVCGGNDGIPRELDSITFSKWRNESIKAYGNAIVPQVVFQIFKAINEYEAQFKELAQ